MKKSLLVLMCLIVTASVFAEPPIQIKGVFPSMTVYAKGVGSNSETGIGALIPWGDKLWAVGYVAHIKGSGIGLYEISDDMTMKKHPESVTGTFANRLVHWASEQAIIGPHIIDAKGNVRTFKELSKHRLTATAQHLKDPKNKVYFLTMEGKVFEANVHTLESKELADLVKELNLPKDSQPHFKAAHTAQGKLVVANNTYEELEYLNKRRAGRLAQWDGQGKWETLEENPFIEVSGKQNLGTGKRYGNTLFAVGWDNQSVIFRYMHDGKWQRRRLPFGGQSWLHTWNTEWMRIREVQTERYIMDAFGIFYELPALVYGGNIWGIKPICNHLRICPDYVYWRGMLVLAGDQTDNAVGQPQSGLWFGNIDELWGWGKPSGWGAVWKDTPVTKGTTSDAFLMTSFDKKVVHFSHNARGKVTFDIEVDVLGNGKWEKYISVPVKGYGYHVFPDGYSAHWVRIKSQHGCNATVQFMYN